MAKQEFTTKGFSFNKKSAGPEFRITMSKGLLIRTEDGAYKLEEKKVLICGDIVMVPAQKGSYSGKDVPLNHMEVNGVNLRIKDSWKVGGLGHLDEWGLDTVPA